MYIFLKQNYRNQAYTLLLTIFILPVHGQKFLYRGHLLTVMLLLVRPEMVDERR